MRAALLALLLALLLAASACGGGDDDGEPAASGDGECESVEAADPREPEAREAPSEPLDAIKSYALVVDTSCGSFTIELDLESAPQTTASLVALARAGFFDGTTFHRVVPSFVIQGGDPTGTGSGGPGYTIQDEAVTAPYGRGTVAMARTTDPNSVGSQFFIVLDDAAQSSLASANTYQIVGTVSSGMDAVDAIAAAADAELPSNPVVMNKVTVSNP